MRLTMNRIGFVAVAIVCFLQAIYASFIVLPHDRVACFYEIIKQGDQMTLSYEVADSIHYDIDFSITDPNGVLIKNEKSSPEGYHSITALSDGKYSYCFNNKMESHSEKTVYFNVFDLEKEKTSSKEHVDPIAHEIKVLGESIYFIKAEQEYIVAREKQHRDTAESTNARVKWWSLGQIFMLASVCMWQVYYLKRFFEVKRVV
ncbi:supernatant protein factor C-terminal domain-containing protein [Spinellus fusiger]|nr:supernatant protein factor C-terminal domain-containing protein [Spinellus fusiger]